MRKTLFVTVVFIFVLYARSYKAEPILQELAVNGNPVLQEHCYPYFADESTPQELYFENQYSRDEYYYQILLRKWHERLGEQETREQTPTNRTIITHQDAWRIVGNALEDCYTFNRGGRYIAGYLEGISSIGRGGQLEYWLVDIDNFTMRDEHLWILVSAVNGEVLSMYKDKVRTIGAGGYFIERERYEDIINFEKRIVDPEGGYVVDGKLTQEGEGAIMENLAPRGRMSGPRRIRRGQ